MIYFECRHLNPITQFCIKSILCSYLSSKTAYQNEEAKKVFDFALFSNLHGYDVNINGRHVHRLFALEYEFEINPESKFTGFFSMWYFIVVWAVN